MYFFVYEIASSFASLIPRNDTKPNDTSVWFIRLLLAADFVLAAKGWNARNDKKIIFKGTMRNFSSFKITITY